jgi:hypothetical protein
VSSLFLGIKDDFASPLIKSLPHYECSPFGFRDAVRILVRSDGTLHWMDTSPRAGRSPLLGGKKCS